jgi:hypothetical protein
MRSISSSSNAAVDFTEWRRGAVLDRKEGGPEEAKTGFFAVLL